MSECSARQGGAEEHPGLDASILLTPHHHRRPQQCCFCHLTASYLCHFHRLNGGLGFGQIYVFQENWMHHSAIFSKLRWNGEAGGWSCNQKEIIILQSHLPIPCHRTNSKALPEQCGELGRRGVNGAGQKMQSAASKNIAKGAEVEKWILGD